MMWCICRPITRRRRDHPRRGPRDGLRRPGRRRQIRGRPDGMGQRARTREDPDHRRTGLACLPRRDRRFDLRARRDGLREHHRGALRGRSGSAGTRDRRPPLDAHAAAAHRRARRSARRVRRRRGVGRRVPRRARGGNGPAARGRPGGRGLGRRQRRIASRRAPTRRAGHRHVEHRIGVPVRLGVAVVARPTVPRRCATHW